MAGTAVGDAFDSTVAESFFGTVQLELLDCHHWSTRDELASAMFVWIECFYNPQRRRSFVGMLSLVDYETANAASQHTQPVRNNGTTSLTPSARSPRAVVVRARARRGRTSGLARDPRHRACPC